jgi:hypothetical protein
MKEMSMVKIKAKITEMAERIYDLSREGKYSVVVGNKAKGLKVVSKRNTNHNKKWRAKN